MTNRLSSLPTIATTLAAAILTAAPAGAVTFDDPASFQELNSWSGTSLDVPGYLGAMMFSEDGDILYVVGDSEQSDHALYAVPVTRDPSTLQVTDLGPAEDVTLVFEGSEDVTGLDAGLEVGPEGTWFYTYFPDNHLGERPGGAGGAETIYDLDLAGVASSVAGLTFSPHVDDPLSGFGQAQLSVWNTTELMNLPLTSLGGGLYEPGTAELFATLPNGSCGAIQYVPYGPFEGDLMHADWSTGEVQILDIDPDTGLAIDADTGLPTLGTTNPVDSAWASDMGVGPWGLEFDPLTGDLFISTWAGNPSDTIIHVTGDGFCSDEDGDGWTDCEGDCDEGDAQIHPGMTEDCNFVDDDCDGEVDEGFDLDADGYFVCDGDCDDGDPAQYPGAAEACNGEDDDCDGDVDEDFDLDLDGVTTCAGDCDDDDAAVYPGADELCNGLDDDCDGEVDEDDAIDVLTWYVDADGDGYGSADDTDVDCDQPDGYVANADDCNDLDPLAYPGAPEECDGQDDDCDGEVDEGFDGDGDGFLVCGGDCDDGDPDQNPAADEVCNGEDDDCDGEIDEDDAVGVLTWYEDGDGDGFGDPAAPDVDCDQPPGFVPNPDDCDDADPDQYPGADELCNGEDDDCDGDVDEDDAVDVVTWYGDADGDGFGDPAVADEDCDQPLDFVAIAGDCDDGDPDVNPDAEEICNGIDDDCDELTDELADGDGDGYAVCDGDCDDADVDVNPDAEEVCDGIDNDCDPATDEEGDGDGDGVSICDGDCDDADPAMFPANPEVCDGIDNDCDGAVPEDETDDDGDGMSECEGDCDDADDLTYDGAPEQCDGIDNDCDAEVDEDVDEDLDLDGFNACQGDCDNGDATVYPGAPEGCDGLDTDCDGEIPEGELDGDLDGWIACEDCDDADPDLNLDDADSDGISTCEGDCDDGIMQTYPGAPEICDGLDNDCDGAVGDQEVDEDGDGFMACEECDDADDAVYPGADEVCDGVDNDCDGATDDVDEDGDGYLGCDDDCDDADADVYPGADEDCEDGVDNDCDGLIDADDESCEDPGDDDTTGDDDDTPADDDDDSVGGGCECESNQAGTGAAPAGFLAITLLAATALARRRF